ncbi:hypothetical protein [Amycolatopsis cihanbeyliensis]|uniref:Uncharacterized protein n=1 Tax=Amycolatopsis cihanbeyliensis TaxID=1128664 RepID=A0A542DIZ8_AMYCI|nr:hypothetical protein [Amycolatopsis cihanbeyliensis]TQJ03081.1 hypothetical protein FB471_2831 [Amycolatopsis cihanbeyliensis]
MNGGAESTEHRAQPTAHAGRHRRERTGTWTPAVPAQHGASRHRAAEDPLEDSVSGSLPTGARRTGAEPGCRVGYPTTRGELPIVVPEQPTVPTGPAPISPAPPVPPNGAGHEPHPAGSAGTENEEPTVRRKRVTLTPRPEAEPATDEESRLYIAPPPDGLSKFDLGSVPASVTPPRSWRKAAWFATASSGGVVVALLFAGSLLVSQPTEPHSQAIDGWPNSSGGQPSVSGEAPVDRVTSTGGTPTGTAEGSGSLGKSRSGLAGAGSGASFPEHSTAASTTRTTTPAPTSTHAPIKPPVTRAPKSTAEPRHVVMFFDPETMGKRSEDYLNLVTEDAARAHRLTTGPLATEGPNGLQRRYADIAYFEVKQVYIDPNQGYTINTVTVTHHDGSKTGQQRTLVFDESNKIEKDAQ